jgi:hypothetical protein
VCHSAVVPKYRYLLTTLYTIPCDMAKVITLSCVLDVPGSNQGLHTECLVG